MKPAAKSKDDRLLSKHFEARLGHNLARSDTHPDVLIRFPVGLRAKIILKWVDLYYSRFQGIAM